MALRSQNPNLSSTINSVTSPLNGSSFFSDKVSQSECGFLSHLELRDKTCRHLVGHRAPLATSKPMCQVVPPYTLSSTWCPTALLLLSRFSRVRLCVTPWTAAHRAPPSLGFFLQEHWSGLPFPSPMHESEK